jgi:dihydrofolate reductase
MYLPEFFEEKMGISIIAAMSRNRVIGKDGAIPWHIPEDLRRFRELTLGHTVIMGRKTFESIGRPLDGRRNVVVTGQNNYTREGTLVVHSLMEAIESSAPDSELFICGGSEIYRQALPLCAKIYLTVVDLDIEGDRYFPPVPADGFREVSRETISESPPARFIIFEKTVSAAGECSC